MIWTALSLVFIILFFFYKNYFFILIILSLSYISFKRNRKEIFITGQVLLLIFSLIRFTYFNPKSIGTNESEYTVIESNKNYVILEQKGIKYLYYEKLEEGNIIEIKANITMLDQDNDFHNYLASQQVYYLVEGKVVSNNNYKNYNNQVIENLLKNKDKENREFLELILFNNKNANEDFYSLFEKFSISFLLVISGFHINLIFKILEKRKIIKYIFTIFYLYLLNFSVSSLKAFLYYCLRKINRKAELVFNNCDLLSLIMISLLFFNPSYCFNLGFIYSFSFSYIIDFINNTIVKKGVKYSFLKKILIFLFSLPIILYNSYQLNTSSFIASLVLVYPISFLFIFSLIYLFLDKFYLVYKLYIKLLRLLLDFLNEYSWDLVFGKPSYIVLLLLYLFLILFLYLYQNKFFKSSYLSLFMYGLIIFVQYSLPLLDSREIVYFLDVGQADCSILKIKNSKKVVIIDTGGSRYKDLATKNIIPFLKSKGIDTIEMIIITHDDFDHNGSKDSLIKNFKVNRTIDNSMVEEIIIGGKIFRNLNVNSNRDNDGSIVLYGEYGDISYLFTGDISGEKEKEIINKYNLEVDVLKVSHHGSDTSTSLEFLEKINPKIALIGVGNNNIYNHPSLEVIKNLNKQGVKIYRTDEDGNIIIYKSLISDDFIIERE